MVSIRGTFVAPPSARRRWGLSMPLVAFAVLLLAPAAAAPVSGGGSPGALGEVLASHLLSPLPMGLTFDAPGAPVGVAMLAPLPSQSEVSLEVGLALQDPQGLATLLGSLEDPYSPSYHHFLTSQEFASRYAPSTSEMSTVEGYFLAHGATSLTPSPDRMSLSLVLPAGDVSSTFGSSLAYYHGANGRFYAPTGPVSLPGPIARDLVQVDGLTNERSRGLQTFLSDLGSFTVPAGDVVPSGHGPAQFDTTTPPQSLQLFWGTDFPAAFDAQGMINSGTTGSGWSVATILWSGHNDSNGVNLPPWDPSAVDQYLTQTFPAGATLPTITAEPVTYGGSTPPLPGTYSLGDDEGGITETSLDLEMEASTAPGAHIYCWYFSGSILTGNSQSSFYGAFDQALSDALSYSYGGNGLAAISNSYGLDDSNDSLWNNLEAQAAAQGTTLFASSGDAGNAPTAYTGRPQGQWPTWPATASFNTYGAVAVGGTEITVNGAPYSTNYNPSNGLLPPMAYDASSITGLQSQVVWYDNSSTLGTDGTEGGISGIYNEPLFQARSAAQSAIIAAASKEGVLYARGIPDLSSVGDNTVIYDDSTPGLSGNIVAGTSIASPVMAGFMVLMDQMDGKQGYFDPALYSIGSYFLTVAPTSGADPFHGAFAVTAGRNWVYNASATGGWSACDGWGTPDIALMAQDLGNPIYTGFVYDPNGVPGRAGPLPGGGTGPNSGVDLNTLIVLVAIVLVVVIVAAVLLRPKHRTAPAPGTVYGTPPASPYVYGYPGTIAPSGPTYVYAVPPPTQAAPPAAAYGTPYGQPSGYPPGYGAPGYGGAAYAAPGYAAQPSPYAAAPQARPMVGPVYYCRYCRNPRPYTNSACPNCGAPL